MWVALISPVPENVIIPPLTTVTVAPFGTEPPPVSVVAPVTCRVPASDIFPAELSVEVAEGVCRVVVPPPVTIAVLVKFPDPTTVTVPVPRGHHVHEDGA